VGWRSLRAGSAPSGEAGDVRDDGGSVLGAEMEPILRHENRRRECPGEPRSERHEAFANAE